MKGQRVAIGEFCKTGSGGTPARTIADNFLGGAIPWVKSGELKSRFVDETEEFITEAALETSSAKLVAKGALLVAMYGATVGEVSELRIDAATNQAVCYIVPDAERCDRNYLFHALFASKQALLKRRVGGAQPNISQGIIRSLEIPLPPLPEQRRIATILDKSDTLRAKRREAISKLDQLLHSVFLDMFGDPVTNPKADVVPLSDVCARITDGTHQSPKWSEAGVPFLFQSNVRPGEISFETKKAISLNEYASLTARCPIEYGDVLYTIVGSYGNAAMVRTHEKFCFQRHIAQLKPNEQILPEYLEAMMNQQAVKRQADKHATGIAQKTLILKELKAIKVLRPSLKRQSQFRDFSQQLRRVRERIAQHDGSAEALFSSLQHRAFSGEL